MDSLEIVLFLGRDKNLLQVRILITYVMLNIDEIHLNQMISQID